MSEKLPALLDCKAVMTETGLPRASAEKLMRNVPTVHIDGLRRTFVRRADVLAYLERATVTVEQKRRVA